ncbi:hypothetical protein [Maridesulfovibrio zosterae]|uniref:hypothetical protein n=1 Tax=Maridesulfovibrio zosterae TaxID=82171 RepID=UPI00041A9781|nr:hypothetical protein [Maridesulfovibrio zosterae]
MPMTNDLKGQNKSDMLQAISGQLSSFITVLILYSILILMIVFGSSYSSNTEFAFYAALLLFSLIISCIYIYRNSKKIIHLEKKNKLYEKAQEAAQKRLETRKTQSASSECNTLSDSDEVTKLKKKIDNLEHKIKSWEATPMSWKGSFISHTILINKIITNAIKFKIPLEDQRLSQDQFRKEMINGYDEKKYGPLVADSITQSWKHFPGDLKYSPGKKPPKKGKI